MPNISNCVRSERPGNGNIKHSTIPSTRKFYDAIHDPDGIINLATAENGLMCDELLKVGLGFLLFLFCLVADLTLNC